MKTHPRTGLRWLINATCLLVLGSLLAAGGASSATAGPAADAHRSGPPSGQLTDRTSHHDRTQPDRRARKRAKVRILTPVAGQARATQAPVRVRVTMKGIERRSVRVVLNGRKVTRRLAVGPRRVHGRLTTRDGVRTGRANVLVVVAKARGDRKPHRVRAVRKFWVRPRPQVTARVPASGGTVSLPGVGTVQFPSGSFTEATTVTLSWTPSTRTAPLFGGVPRGMGAHHRLAHDVHVTVGRAQPRIAPRISLVSSPGVRRGASRKDELRVLAVNGWSDDSGPGGELLLDMFPLGARFSPAASGASVGMPVSYFTDLARTDGRFELVTTLALTPTAPSTTPRPGSHLDTPGPVITDGPDAQRATPGVRRVAADPGCEGPALDHAPLDNPTQTSRYGERVHPVLGVRRFHAGVDLQAAVGTPAYATGDGVVQRVTTQRNAAGQIVGAGHYLVIQQDNGTLTRYFHLREEPALAVGDQVTAGQVVAHTGMSGLGNGPHLHFEYYPNGTIAAGGNRGSVDPVPCFDPEGSASITVNDNGTEADDAFTVTLDDTLVCRTTTGASNSCSVGGLRPGRHHLVLFVDEAPDDAGTYEVTLGDGLTFADGSTYKTGTAGLRTAVGWTVDVPEPQ